MVGPIESASPALCRLHLSTELRRLREEKGLTAGEVARRFHWAPSKMTRLEKGDDGVIKPSDVMLLCQIYDADRRPPRAWSRTRWSRRRRRTGGSPRSTAQ
jgi:transcriptional regulator with XRE-family HTH domain